MTANPTRRVWLEAFFKTLLVHVFVPLLPLAVLLIHWISFDSPAPTTALPGQLIVITTTMLAFVLSDQLTSQAGRFGGGTVVVVALSAISLIAYTFYVADNYSSYVSNSTVQEAGGRMKSWVLTSLSAAGLAAAYVSLYIREYRDSRRPGEEILYGDMRSQDRIRNTLLQEDE